MDKKSIGAKRRARRLALQALYQWQMSGQQAYEVETQFKVFTNLERVDVEYFTTLFKGSVDKIEDIDKAFSPHLDRDFLSLNPVELAILRISTYEFLHVPELPWRIILDESVNMGKEFGSTDGHKYVNGVLNKVAHDIRSVEVAMDNTKSER